MKRATHRWALTKRLPFAVRKNMSLFARAPLEHCVKCGATKKELWMDDMNPRQPRPIYFAHYAAPWQKITRMPECLGLPADYDPPVGA